jgi:acyl-CoA thioesterase I
MRESNIELRPVACLVVLLLVAGACGACSNPDSPSGGAVPVRRVMVLGDSLAVTPSPGESFPAVLQSRIAASGLPWTVTNASVSGDTTVDGLGRYEPLLQRDVGIRVLELGANDGLDGLDVAAMERNLGTIIEAAQARRIRVLLCGMETPPLRGFSYALAFHEVFPRTARRYNIPLVPFLLTGVAFIPELNGPDGIHPNAAGARRIAENVWPFLEPMLRESTVTNG